MISNAPLKTNLNLQVGLSNKTVIDEFGGTQLKKSLSFNVSSKFVMDHSEHQHDEEDGGCSMSMIFHGGHCEYILFKSWVASTVLQFTLACIGIFFVAVAYEALKYFREKWYIESKTSEKLKQQCSSSRAPRMRHALLSKIHIAQSCLHFIQVTVSYALMLIVMTYNVWLCFAVVLGASLGYYFFGWMRPIVDSTECCN